MTELGAALVTGSGRGIGRATALVLARRGLKIAVHDIDKAAAARTVAEIAAAGGEAQAWGADVADIPAMRDVVSDVERSLGPIGVLVNNAGTPSDRCPLESVTPEMFERSIAVHVRGTLFTTQAVVPGMKRRNSGRIVNLSSTQGLVGQAEGATYNAAKGAVLALMKGWAREFAPWGITVNAVAPGHTATEMTTRNDPPSVRARKAEGIPLRRYAEPEEIAAAIAFIAGPDARFITGQVISPNGGFVIT
jgi:3-oxoacyl-[acyl-carrier protein] reductase